MKRTICSYLILVFLFWSFYPEMGWALPTDYAVESGDVTFDTSEANTLIINASDHAIISFGEFSIAQNETVRFIQPFDTASVLARVTGGTQSDIYGSLLANGELVFVNPAGIYFHDAANVQVGSLVASTLEIQNAMYLNNQLEFQKVMGSNPGQIFNDAALAALSGGHLALLAESVTNRGILSAELGSVVIGAGTKQIITFDSNGLINLVIDEGVARDIQNAQPLIQNQGTISADGGKVLLSAKALSDTFDSLINTEGVVSATRAVERDGKIIFESNGAIENTGTINTNVFDEHGYSFRTSGTLMGGVAFYDNLDGAADISGSIGSNQSDTGNLTVIGNITLTADNLTFTADSDNDGVGAFSMNSGTQIDGSASTYNLTLKTGQDSTLRSFTRMGNLVFDRAGSASTPTYTEPGTGDNITAETVTINSNTTLSMGASRTLYITSSGTPFTVNGTFTAASSSSVEFQSTAATTIPALTYGGLYLAPASGTPTYTFASGTITVENLYIANYNGGQPTVTANTNDPDLTVTDFTMEGVTAFQASDTGAFNISDDFTIDANVATFTPNGDTVTFTGTGTQLITDNSGSSTTISFGNIVHSGSGTLDISTNLSLTGSFSSTNGAVDSAGYGLTIGDDFSLSSGATFTKGSGITFNGTTTSSTITDSNATSQNLGVITTNKTSGVAATDTVTLGSNVRFDTLTIGSGDTFNLGSSGYTLNLSNAGATATVLTNNGTFTAGTSTTQFSATNSGGNINIPTLAYSSLQLSGAETYALTGNLTSSNALTGNLTVDSGATLDTVSGSNYGITLAGNLSVNSGGTFSAQNGTVTFSGSGTQTVNMGGTGAGHTLYNLVQSGTGTLQTTSNDLKVDNDFTLNSGAGTFDNATNDRAITVTGNVTMDNSRTDMGDATWTVSGNFDYQSVTTFNRNASTLVMDGSGKTLTMNSGGNNALNNVTISGTVSTSGASRIGGILVTSGTLTIPSGTLNMISGADVQVTSTGRITGNGTLDINHSSNLSQMDGTIDVATLRFIRAKTAIDPGQYDSATVIFRQDSTANNSVILSNGTYIFTGNVTFETTSSGTLTVLNSTNNPNFDFRGNVDFNQSGGGTLTWTKGGGTITLGNNSSDGTQTIDFLGRTVEDIVVNASGDTKQLAGSVTTDTFTLTAGTWNANGNAVTVSGAAAFNGGVYQASTATQTFDGGLTVAGATFTGSTGDVDVNGVFTLSSGTFTAPGNLYVSDDFLFAGGSFGSNSGRVTLDTTTTATVNVSGAGTGSISFYDFYITTAGKTVEFGAGDTFNITNASTWTVTGATGNLITLQSTSSGTAWNVNPAGWSVSYVNVSDSNNLGASAINPSNSTDGGRNTNWFPSQSSSGDGAGGECPSCGEVERNDDGASQEAGGTDGTGGDAEEESRTFGDGAPSADPGTTPADEEIEGENATDTFVHKGTVYVIDRHTGIVHQIFDGEKIRVTPKDVRLRMRELYIAMGDGILALRGKTLETLKKLKLKESPSGLAPTRKGDKVYAVFNKSRRMNQINTAFFTSKDFIENLGIGPADIVLDRQGDTAYVANEGEDSIQIFDMKTGKALRSIEVGSMPTSLVLSQDEKYLYVTERLGRTVSKIDLLTGKKVSSQPAGKYPYGIGLTEDKIFVTDPGTDHVFVYDRATDRSIASLKIGGAPYSVEVSPSGKRVFIASREKDVISILDARSLDLLSEVKVGRRPSGLLVLPEGNKLYVTNQVSGTLSEISIEEGQEPKLSQDIYVGAAPSKLRLSTPGDV